jgi:hypothetical protein
VTTFRTATVFAELSSRPGLQRVEVTFDEGGRSRAYALTELTGPVAVGDRVVVNTTAVDLGLGTGGWHVVHWNLANEDGWRHQGPGHVMKLRYSSLQADTGCVEELEPDALADADDLGGMPVVVCGLHSQVACVAAALRQAAPDARIAYVMTDGAALPLALSDLVVQLKGADLLDVTLTAGHAFGGDHEAVNVPSALVAARHVAHADVAIVAMGPGVVGTGTKLGYSALEVAPILDATSALGGRAVACLRFSEADARPRHQGVSHHTRTALRMATCPADVAVPRGPWAERIRTDLDGTHHRLHEVDDPDVPALLETRALRVTSMGRGPDEDPAFYAVAGAAGTLAAP